MLAAAVVVRYEDPAFVESMRLRAFDSYQKLWPREAQKSTPVYVVAIDEKSLATVGQWPWPRPVVAEIIETLFEKYKIKALGFDMVFAEPDRTSPELISKNWSIDKNLRTQLQQLPSNEEPFLKAIHKYPVVMGHIFAAGIAETDEDFWPKSTAVMQGNVLPFLEKMPFATRNLPAVEKEAQALGHFSISPQHDSVIRRVPTFINHNNTEPFPSLALELLRMGTGEKGYTLKMASEQLGLEAVQVGNYQVPVDGNGSFWVRYREHNFDRYIPAVDVLLGDVPAEGLEGAYVLFGAKAAGLYDLRSTPLEASWPGVEVHMQSLETILEGDFLERPAVLNSGEVLLVLLLGVVMLFLVEAFGAIVSGVIVMVLMCSIFAVSIYAFRNDGYLLDVSYPSMSLLVIFSLHVLLKYMNEETSRKAIRSAFSYYLSPDMVRIVSRQPDKLKLGGDQRDMTVLFSDVREFTALSEKLKPEELTAMLNAYLTPMTEIVQDSKGTIDKYIGDAIMAFWNAPLDLENHERRACMAALEMIHRMETLNQEFRETGFPEMDIGIGINSGLMNVGNMGSQQRFDYTVMGDNVNLASRLEGLCKLYGVGIIVSQYIKDQVDDAICIPLDLVAVKGRTEPVMIYELVGIGEATERQQESIQTFEKFIRLYRAQKWDEAEKILQQSNRPQILKNLYEERINLYRDQPPAPDWGGVYVAIAK